MVVCGWWGIRFGVWDKVGGFIFRIKLGFGVKDRICFGVGVGVGDRVGEGL